MKNKSILSTLGLIMIKSYLYPTVATKQTVFAQQTTKPTTNFLPYVNSTYGIRKKTVRDRIQKLTLLHSPLQV
ncbi:MAG: hypothetical protein WAZ77_07715 [Candidatus Nitrosopolaris sp.]|jgi:hypothetical protein